MSQMPDKIWLHKDTKYNTADEVFGYQYEFAQEIECEGIENFVEYIPTDAFIDKAARWIENNLSKYSELTDEDEYGKKLKEPVMNVFYGQAVKDFINYMKG